MNTKGINQFIEKHKDSPLDTDKINGGSASKIDAVVLKDGRRGNIEIAVFT